MIKAIDNKKDMRFRILWYLYKNDFGLEQHSANDFLATLKTTIGTSDLGSIRRALLDLKRSGFLQETQEGVDISSLPELKTSGFPAGSDYDSICNPERFVKEINGQSKIPQLYIGITLDGINFLLTHDNHLASTEISKKESRNFTAIICMTALTLIVGIIQIIVDIYCS